VKGGFLSNNFFVRDKTKQLNHRIIWSAQRNRGIDPEKKFNADQFLIEEVTFRILKIESPGNDIEIPTSQQTEGQAGEVLRTIVQSKGGGCQAG
jgi:hypothetical protein